MEMYPASMMDFMDMFPTEEACLEYLGMVRWPEGYSCLRCGSKDASKIRSGYYRCRPCRYRGSVIFGTLFQDTRKPLHLWFQAIWYVVNQKNGVSALGLQKALGLGSYHTAWEWLHKLRRAMVRPGREKLSGLVEMDETFIGGVRFGKRGRGAEGKMLVLIAVEDTGKGIGRIRLSTIPGATGEAINNATFQMVDLGSTIRSDGWDGYKMLANVGYVHAPVTHALAASGDATPLAHRVASLLKRWWLGTHQGAVSPDHLACYLDEFTFRFNRRTARSRGKLFYRLVEQALQIGPIPGKALPATYSG
ncbi:MAG: IS1595 family transposase [Nitrospirota bacterium]|nr:IS1595 family transposase [Nitrospirota bacterium]